MARRPRASRIETRSARLKLPVRFKPYDFTTISPGIALGYRRNRSAGTWVLRAADGRGSSWTKRVGLADDFEAADGEHVLTFWQAQDKARKLARGSDAASTRPHTVADAVAAYKADLVARGGDLENATRIAAHLTPTLAAKPVALLRATELAAWRDRLLADGMKPATLVRLAKSVKAALNLAARRDPRIVNRAAWGDGLGGIAEGYASRNVQRLDDAQVLAVIAAAYAIDPSFGLYVEVLAVTGARASQVARLTVADLQQNGGGPRLMMPASHKGRGRKPGKAAVPVTAALAGKLASNRAAPAPLLLRSDGQAWQSGNAGDHSRMWGKAAADAGLAGTVMYALRQSSITRALIAGVPVRIVAALHDTSVDQIERTYSAHITTHADELARRALLITTTEVRPTGKAAKKI
jgi:integrase